MNPFKRPCKNCIDRRTLLKGTAAAIPGITLASQAGITLAQDKPEISMWFDSTNVRKPHSA